MHILSGNLLLVGLAFVEAAVAASHGQEPLQGHPRMKSGCPDYSTYSRYTLHPPFSKGPLGLPFQRPSTHCRTFASPAVEQIIEYMMNNMKDADLARLFENSFPNTLDTTVKWHTDGPKRAKKASEDERWQGSHTFIVTGDINAEWLRDSTNQLAQYQPLAKKDKAIHNLILGAINTQAEFVIAAPYCNAFQPPPPSKLRPSDNGMGDTVHPAVEPAFAFECKYELDSLASFLSLSNQFYNHTGSTEFMTERWYKALKTIMKVIEEQSKGTFAKNGQYQVNEYTFMRTTTVGSETLNLRGQGNPLNSETGLVRSAFRPSDDATILQYLIPANAMMSVELMRTGMMLEEHGDPDIAAKLRQRSDTIRDGIYEFGVVQHKRWGKVFAFEVDGYGSSILMDDANVPSLLALPVMGFVDVDDPIYQNTRKMILNREGNPYYLNGYAFQGIGGPHIGLESAWPMSLLVRILTSDDDEEILENLELIKKAGARGLINESVNVNFINEFTRSWFAWANSVFAQTILDLAQRKPHLMFGRNGKPYIVGQAKEGE